MRAADVSDWSMKIGHVGILNDLLAGLEIPEDDRRDVMRLLDKGDFAGLGAKVSPMLRPSWRPSHLSLEAVMSSQQLVPCSKRWESLLRVWIRFR